MSFDTIAPHYRWLEFVTAGSLLQRCRTEFLDRVADARTVLLPGEGHGRFLLELLRVNPEAHVTCLDASARMLAIAERHLDKRSLPKLNVRFVHADICSLQNACGTHDLIASHFFLDCFRPEQLPGVISRIADAARPGALWLLSDFREPETGWRRVRAQAVLKLAYFFFRRATHLPASRLTNPDPFLNANGFQLVRRSVRHFGLLHSDLWIKNRPVTGRARSTDHQKK